MVAKKQSFYHVQLIVKSELFHFFVKRFCNKCVFYGSKINIVREFCLLNKNDRGGNSLKYHMAKACNFIQKVLKSKH